MSEPTEQAEGAAETAVQPRRPRPAAPALTDAEPPNAWHRSQRGAAVVLLLNVVLFVYACLLFSRLTTGEYFSWGQLVPAGREPLGQVMLAPISIYQSPLEGLVLGGLLALFVAGPILVAQFYGVGWGRLLVAFLLVMAHMPLLAGAMLVAIWLATTHRLGIRNRLVSGLAALAAPVAALWISTGATESIAQAPMERAYLHYPWLAAVVLAAVMLAMFWVLARLLRYRAGLSAILLGLPLAAASGLFAFGVGGDELAFRLLDARCGLNTAYFHNRDLADVIDAHVRARIGERGGPEPTERERAGIRGEVRTALRWDVENELNESRRVVGEACERFADRFPDSRYRPYVLYLMARSQDMRADLVRVSTAEQCFFYDDQVSLAGQTTWLRLLVEHRFHPLSIVARVRLAKFHLARGQIAYARDLLGDAAHVSEATRQRREPFRPPHRLLEIFNLRPRDPDIDPIVDEQVKLAERWSWLIEQNRDPDAANDQAIAEWFKLDRNQSGDYVAQIKAALRQYQQSRLADNFELLLVLATPESDKRIEALRAFVAQREGSKDDALVEAMAELAALLSRGRSADREQARACWQTLVDRWPGSPFAAEATAGLANLPVESGNQGRP